MAMEPSVTVVEISGDDDEEWGEEDEVVVWSKGVHDTTATANGDSRRSSFHHSGSGSVDHSPAGRREEGGHPRGLLIASLANLAISYNVVSELRFLPISNRSTAAVEADCWFSLFHEGYLYVDSTLS